MTAALLAAAAARLWLRPASRVPGAGRSMRTQPGRVAAVAVVGAVVALGSAAGAPQPAALALVLGGTAWGAHRIVRQRAAARAVCETRDRVLECCELLAAELASGQPGGAALGRASETWSALAPVAQTHAYGGDVPAALRRVAAEPGAEGMALAAAAWHVAHRTGHGLSEALGRVAWALRQARSTDRVVRGELASARATARLVAALPLVALAIGAGSGGDPLGFLLGTPLGLGCLAGGLGLGLAGLAWIERIAAEVSR